MTAALRRIPILLCIAILVSAVICQCQAQTTQALSQVKKVYVAPLGDRKGADAIRQRIADRLQAVTDRALGRKGAKVLRAQVAIRVT